MWYPDPVALEIIPTSADPAYRQTTALSGREYVLDFDYTERDGAHLLSITLDDGIPLVKGLALIPGRLLLQGLRSDDRPPGDLLVIADRDVPEIGDFGSGAAVLVYLTDDELDETRAQLTEF